MKNQSRQKDKNFKPSDKPKNIDEIKNFWIPKTSLGRDVADGIIKSIEDVFKSGKIIKEPEIIDVLIPDLKEEIMFIGGTPGKGGGKKRTAIRATTRMHRAGRRRTVHSFVCVGNANGLIGYSYVKGKDMASVLEKARKQAKLNIFPIRRGCGSWECRCKTNHSIPFNIGGRSGSILVKLFPAPKGLNLCTSNEIKKIMNLAGIKDIWMKSYGPTKTSINFILAVINAFENLNKFKVNEKYSKVVGLDQICIAQ